MIRIFSLSVRFVIFGVGYIVYLIMSIHYHRKAEKSSFFFIFFHFFCVVRCLLLGTCGNSTGQNSCKLLPINDLEVVH